MGAEKKKKEEDAKRAQEEAKLKKEQDEARKLLGNAGEHLVTFAEKNKWAQMKPLLDVNANPDTPNSKKEYPLQIAAARGNLKVLNLLLEAKADVKANYPDKKKNTALHLAAEGQYAMIVEVLLAANADP